MPPLSLTSRSLSAPDTPTHRLLFLVAAAVLDGPVHRHGSGGLPLQHRRLAGDTRGQRRRTQLAMVARVHSTGRRFG